MLTAKAIIDHFHMKPLPDEGGFYVETYRSPESIAKAALSDRYDGPRHFSTAILYLITPEHFSKLHRVKSDEIIHFYCGDPVTMLQLHPDGKDKTITLGNDIEHGHQLQVIVPQGIWQGSFLSESGRFALLGCTVSPGFEFTDSQSANRDELLRQHPQQIELIRKLT